MASNEYGGAPPAPITSTTVTTSVTLSGRRRSRTSGEAERISTRQFNPIPTIETTEPFPSLAPEPRPQPLLSPQRTRENEPATATDFLHLTPSRPVSSQAARRRPIGIRRIPSSDARPVSVSTGERKRANSAGQRPTSLGHELASYRSHDVGQPLHPTMTASSNLGTVVEGQVTRIPIRVDQPAPPEQPEDTTLSRTGSQRLRSVSDAAKSTISRMSGGAAEPAPGRQDGGEYNTDVVDLLDVLDPEVSTLTTLTNVQNSLFVPDLGRWLNRRPTYELSRVSSRSSSYRHPLTPVPSAKPLPPSPIPPPVPPSKDKPGPEGMSDIEEESLQVERTQSALSMVPSIASVVQDEHYAVLPHGTSLDGWTDEEKELLDDYVRHMMHSKRSKFKRTMKAFGKYIRKPLGFFVTLYAVLITLFGLAWVLFLIGWISVGARQLYIINIIDNVLVALFAIVGDGLAPFRAVDTYHMCFIAHYHHLSWRLRKEKALPKLQDHNDLPEKTPSELDLEASQKVEDGEFSVLTPEQQKKLQYHSDKFSKSHSFYKPHETTTHHAFPLRLLVAIVVLLDCHSLFQIALGSCTWGISYHHRPPALTPTILSFSITVNITAGILIKVGDARTRKKDVLLRMSRQQLTQEAMKKVTKRKENIVDADKKLDEQLDQAWEKKHPDAVAGRSLRTSSGSSEAVADTK